MFAGLGPFTIEIGPLVDGDSGCGAAVIGNGGDRRPVRRGFTGNDILRFARRPVRRVLDGHLPPA